MKDVINRDYFQGITVILGLGFFKLCVAKSSKDQISLLEGIFACQRSVTGLFGNYFLRFWAGHGHFSVIVYGLFPLTSPTSVHHQCFKNYFQISGVADG